MTESILCCGCGWSGTPRIRNSYEKNMDACDDILHTISRHCKSCDKQLTSLQTVIQSSRLIQKEKQDLGIKLIPLPHTFTTRKFEMEIFEDKFTIYSMDITDVTRVKHIFRSTNRIECIGEIFYDIILHPIIPDDRFSVEYRITEGEVDAFCEYFLEHFTVDVIKRQRRFPTNPAMPNVPNIPVPNNPGPWQQPYDPNRIPWIDPNKIPVPYKFPSPKKTDPWADADDIIKRWADASDIIKKYKEIDNNRDSEDNLDYDIK